MKKPAPLKQATLAAKTISKPAQYQSANATERTRGRVWRRLREIVLKRDGYLCQCAECRRTGTMKLAHEVDHITPLANGGTDSLDNLQAINRDCHKRKSLGEAARGGATMHPDWLPHPFALPVVVLCGPPGAGKMDAAMQMRTPADMVLDLDALCVELLGRELWQCSPEQRGHVIRNRNALIADYLRGRTHYARLILIATEAKPEGRAWWAERGAEVKTILRPAKACFDAIDMRPYPERVKAQQRAIVACWR